MCFTSAIVDISTNLSFVTVTGPKWCGHVAQLVEHLTFNQTVTGSDPVVLTIFLEKKDIIC